MSRFERAAEIFHEVMERDPGERRAFLEERCGGDEDLRREVESLLAADRDAGTFLKQPAVVVAGLAGPDASLAPGTTIGPYRVDREIGHGGMAIVYLAEDTRLGRQVAVKILAPDFAGDEARRARMRLEARAAAALTHPGIATVYALEEFDGRLCLVCEYVPGETLRAELDHGPLVPGDVIDVGVQVAEALSAAHSAGVVHRDLKPENVIRGEGGRVRILDFGVARFAPAASRGVERLTRAGMVLGTPAYMSPEQLEGGEVDGRSDIFSLGVLLFELVSGTHPFETTTPVSTAARILAADPPSLVEIAPGTPPGLDRVVARCLRKSPHERYQSAADVARDLAALRSDGQAASTIPGPPVPTPPAPRRRLRLTPRQWWLVHQAAAMGVAALMVWPVAMVHDTVKSDWTLALLLAVIGAAALNGTLRAHLLFTSAYYEGELRAQLQLTDPLLRLSDVLLAALLLASAIPSARTHTVRSAILAAVALGWVVTSVVIEPATRRAAFPRRSSGARPS